MEVHVGTWMFFVLSLLSITTLLTALLNSGVILVILITKRLHLPANYLICSLAVTDLLVAILVMPLSILYIAMDQWPLGFVLCKAWLSIDMTCCTCSILHLCAIALDRYWAITKALVYAHKRTSKWVFIIITAVWTISTLIAIPPLFWRHHNDSNNVSEEDSENVSGQCFIKHDHVFYTIYSTFGAFYFPMALILVLYCRIFITARTLYYKRTVPGSQMEMRKPEGRSNLLCCFNDTMCQPELPMLDTERNKLNIVNQKVNERIQICASRERRAAGVLGLILGAFILCWSPFFVRELLVGFKVVACSSQKSGVLNILTWLGYTNSLINPILYTSFNDEFKQAFGKLLRCKSPNG